MFAPKARRPAVAQKSATLANQRPAPVQQNVNPVWTALATRVESASTLTLHRKSHSCACSSCSAQAQERLLRSAESSADSGAPASAATSVPPLVGDVLRSGGQALDAGTRAYFEPRLGMDLGQVRIHTGARASESARAVDAVAYTVGRDIVLGSGSPPPESDSGRRLLAHELVHVAQQGDSAPAGSEHVARMAVSTPHDPEEREADRLAEELVSGSSEPGQGVAPSARRIARMKRRVLQRQILQMASGRNVGNSPAPTDNLREEVILAMDRLHALWSMTNAEWAAEYPTVGALPANSHVSLPLPGFHAALTRNEEPTLAAPVANATLNIRLTAAVGQGQTNQKPDIVALQHALHASWFITTPDFGTENAAVTAAAGPTIPEAMIPRTLAGIAALKRAIVAGRYLPGIRRTDLMAPTHAVTPAEHNAVELQLRPPGTSVAVPIGGGAPVVVAGAAMTGLPPVGGGPGAFQTQMNAALHTYLRARAAAHRAEVAAGPRFPMAQANTIATAAQGEVERHFAPYLQVASHSPSDAYHPGTYQLASVIHSQAAVPITDDGSPGRPGRRGWVGYWMNQDTPGGPVMTAHHCDTSRPIDSAEFDRVQDAFATDPANRTEIDDTIHGWPAEASSGVNVQPYQAATRSARWDLFTTLIHEMMHVAQHPNYERAYNAISGHGQEVLKEGMADVMRHDLWDGPGNLSSRLATPALQALRGQVQGGDTAYYAADVVYHNDYPGKYPRARDAVYGPNGVGIANAKAAFFLGRTELLGLGAGTGSVRSLAGIGNYTATASADAEIVVAAAGDTYDTIRARTNAPPNGLLDPATNTPLAAGAAIAPGTRVLVHGIRYLYTVAEDTLGSIAHQNAMSIGELARANNLPALTTELHRFPAGTRLLIPIHTARP